MRIVCISASLVPASTANSIQVMKVCQALAQLGHEVQLLVPQNAPRATSIERPASDLSAHLVSFYGLQTPFPVEWLPASPWWKRYDFSWAAVRRAKALGAEAVWVWPPQAAVFALLRRLPVLLELHGEPEGKLGPLLFRLFLGLPGNKCLLPITQALVDLLKATYPVSRVPVCVSPNGVDLARYQDLPSPAEARRTLGLPETLTVGYTGHLYPGRGMGLLVELARRFSEVRFLWVGGQPKDVEHWQQQLASDRLANVTLTGFIENSRLPLYQAAADILLMPYERVITGSSGGNSAAYCSPMKMFEYMACGRAILSSDLPVIHEVLNETNAVLCPPEAVDAWAKALSALLTDQAGREALALRTLQAVQGYTWTERARKALDKIREQ